MFKKRTLDDINLYRLVCGGATVVALAGAAVLEWPQIYAERATLLVREAPSETCIQHIRH